MTEDPGDNLRLRKLLSAFPEKALQFLYQKYYSTLVKLCLRYTQDEAAAEDITQEAFVLVWEKHKELGRHHDSSLANYLARIVKYKAITRYRKELKEKAVKAEFVQGMYASPGNQPIEIQIVFEEWQQYITKVISSFPIRERQCLLMKVEQGMTIKAIAMNLAVSEKAVQRSLTSGRKRLRRHLKKDEF